jgi:hypothetical protein
MKRAVAAVVLWVGGVGILGCGAQDAASADSSGESQGGEISALEQSDRTLALGSSGEDVRAVTRYLTRFGYLPNAALSRTFPEWRSPVANAPEREDVYDENTAAAVQHLQLALGIADSGVVDAETRAVMLQPRCGVPESTPLDSSNKFDPSDTIDDSTSNWTWTLANLPAINHNNATRAQYESAITTALGSWYRNPHTFSKGSGAGVDIYIKFTDTNYNNQPWGGAYAERAGTAIFVNNTVKWSTASATPGDALDFQSVLVHEIGHRLGYGHSAAVSGQPGPVMYSAINPGLQRRNLTPDDNMSVLAHKGVRWTYFDYGDTDIDVDSGPTFQTITVLYSGAPISGGYTVYQLYNGGWSVLGGQGAVRVGGNGGYVWIVQDDGDVFWWDGTWHQVPGACAHDIAVGGDNSVWIVGCFAITGGYPVYKYDGSSFVQVSGNVGGVRIGVGFLTNVGQVPWIVQESGAVRRRNSTSTSSGTWTALDNPITYPEPNAGGSDIAVSANGFAWLVGNDVQAGGHSIYLWNEQAGGGTGSSATRTLAQWRKVYGNAVNVSTNNEGYPYVVNSDGNAWAGN